MKRLALIALLTLLLAGCATAPTEKELANADYGLFIAMIHAKEIALNFLHRHLKDAGTARIEWGYIEKGWIRDAPIYGWKLVFGYKLDATVNAKNSFGGCTGFKPYLFMFRNGSLVTVYAEQEVRSGYSTSTIWEKIY